MIFKFYNKSLTSATHETISSGEFERSFVLSVFKTDLHVQSLWKFSSLKLKFSLINKYVNILRLFVDLNIDLVWWLQNNQWSMLYESESLNYRWRIFPERSVSVKPNPSSCFTVRMEHHFRFNVYYNIIFQLGCSLCRLSGGPLPEIIVAFVASLAYLQWRHQWRKQF